jgi:hypothetical protein
MDTGSIVLISLTAAILMWNVWQSYKHGHFKSQCALGYDDKVAPA